MTQYKNIYKHTYWGAFTMEQLENHQIEEAKQIIENRNKLVEDNDIMTNLKEQNLKYVNNFLRILADENKEIKFDHVEIYKLKDGRILVLNSPYRDNDYYLTSGWKKEKQLYNGAVSYSKVLNIEDVKKPKKNTDYLKTFYSNHPEYSEKIKCPICDQYYMYSNKSKHMKTKIHVICTKFNKT
jgi:DNA-directed RNA polymerase subunit F